MRQAGMDVRVGHAGNIRGCYPGADSSAPRLIIGSHLDTVPNAGAFDGALGVHHPDESVLVEDAGTALHVGMRFLDELERVQ